LITVEPAFIEALAALRAQLASWECDQLAEIVALDRVAARNPAHVAPVEQATGILLLGDDPLRWAAILGGTPLAQTIRRANARSKLVAGIGAAGAFLCQHIVTPALNPTTLPELVTFGPGLGLVNRLVIETAPTVQSYDTHSPTRLLVAVAANPFLIGVALAPESAAILYPDNTLQASGPNTVTIVDGQSVEAADFAVISTVPPSQPMAGALYYRLRVGDGFNLDDRSFRPAGEVDLPPTGPVTSVF
jgi:cyanophycinase